MLAQLVSRDDVAAFRDDGFCVLPQALPAHLLELLREECQRAIELVEHDMDRAGVDVIGGSRRGLQYLPGNCRHRQPRLDEVLFGDPLTEICAALLGPRSFLVWEQYSVKLGTDNVDLAEAGPSKHATYVTDGNPQSLGRFSWHQDSGYVPCDHEPYLSCWIALDDATTDNGALRVIPFSEIGVRTRVQHLPDADNNDLVGYFGPATGKTIEVAAGGIVCFSSALFHRSPRNRTASPRRAYLAQYASTVHDRTGAVLWPDAPALPR
jgi:hypothetical protein